MSKSSVHARGSFCFEFLPDFGSKNFFGPNSALFFFGQHQPMLRLQFGH